MVSTPFRLSDVIDAHGSLSWQESIALVQSVIAASASGRAESGDPSGTIADDFVLKPDGTVAPAGAARRAVSVSELALFLGQLLPSEGNGAERPPAGVKFTIARSLGLVEAPPIVSIAQFSSTLGRFERQERATLLAALHDRCASLLGPNANERRERRPAADVFRRLLREADERAWNAAQAAAAARFDDRVSATRVDVLRRFLREADERNFLLAAALRERTTAAAAVARPRAGGLAARRRQLHTGMSVLALVAAATVAEQYQAGARHSPHSPPRQVRAERLGRSAALDPIPVVPPLPSAPVVSSQLASRHQSGAPLDAPPATSRGAVATRGEEFDPAGQSAGRMVEALDVNRKPIFSPSFSADGSAVFFDSGTGATSAVMTAQRARPGSDVNDLRVVSLVDDGARNYHPHLSPDNRTLAFDSDRDGERGVYLADRDGRHVRRVSGPGYAAVPTWSPDSRRLAFVKAEPDRPNVWNVWVLDVAGGSARRVTDYRYGQPWGASWFPDGRRICYAHEDRLVVLDLENGRSQSYASPEPGRLVRTPAVSPNGHVVAFQLYRDGVWLLDLRHGGKRRILDDPSAEEFAWTPDGRQLAFHSKRSGEWGVWFMAPEP